MSTLKLFQSDGKALKDLAVADELISGPIRKGLLYYMVQYQLAKRRRGTHASKTRGMVTGSTKKIYRQKGTGRARHGDAKAPIFVGGGKVFGPHPRSYAFNMPKSAKRRALQVAIALKNREGKLLLLETPKWAEPKTKQALGLFKALKTPSALLVLDGKNEIVEKSVRNLVGYKVLTAECLNVYDILNYDHLVLTPGALEKVVKRLGISA
jgi:large subunit ribosomal protein L4